MRLSRCEVRDHINYRKNDRWRSYRFYRALQRLKSPMRYICEIFGAPRFSSFSTQSAMSGRSIIDTHRPILHSVFNSSTSLDRLLPKRRWSENFWPAIKSTQAASIRKTPIA